MCRSGVLGNALRVTFCAGVGARSRRPIGRYVRSLVQKADGTAAVELGDPSSRESTHGGGLSSSPDRVFRPEDGRASFGYSSGPGNPRRQSTRRRTTGVVSGTIMRSTDAE
jgi:hypothetical protein